MPSLQGEHASTTGKGRPRVLIVDDEPAVAQFFRKVVAADLNCQTICASSLREAREAIRNEPLDLMVTDVELPDGSGLTLLPEFRDRHPQAEALVITGSPSAEHVLGALRGGARDLIPKPFAPADICARVRSALDAQQRRAKYDQRIEKLKVAVKRLKEARNVVSRKVDLLCNDLVSAYGELSRQLDHVRVQESYRQFLRSSSDLEQLLCHTMDWMLRQVGYCNIGIWLADAEQELQLGAYMKYTVAADQDLTHALQRNLLRVAARRGFVRLRETDPAGTQGSKVSLTPPELKYLAGHDVLAINCSYLGECLGVMLLFRDVKVPFSDDDVAAVKTICPLFSLELTKAVRGNPAGEASAEPDEPGPVDEKDPKPRKKPDPADWWKRGEAPPF